jgi:hypothetical protein
MFARFTQQAREAMVLAQEESARLRYPWLGTEHLLLGLLRQSGTTPTIVLEDSGSPVGRSSVNWSGCSASRAANRSLMMRTSERCEPLALNSGKSGHG